MFKKLLLIIAISTTLHATAQPADTVSWIRINLLGYKPGSIKTAIWCSKTDAPVESFTIVDVLSGKMVLRSEIVKKFGSYGPFKTTARLDFSALRSTGRFVIMAGGVSSPEFTVAENVYDGAADFCLRYMRQQRSGFNPFLKDSCHNYDGYTLYGPMPDSTRIDAVGGWHDASDYLQYVTTSANATYNLLAAWRDFPKVFGDNHQANGLPGKNGKADVLDEAKWGMDWLLKMHPGENLMFNQLGDDRDHKGMRIPKLDSFYGRGYERPVYFLSGEPQQQGKKMNSTTGAASTAGKFSSAFSLGYTLLKESDPGYAELIKKRSLSAYAFGKAKPGYSQTASVLSPYVYAEANWADDMELAAARMFAVTGDKRFLQDAMNFAKQEKITPWLGKDTAAHYQWYPFINVGHYELARIQTGKKKAEITGYYKRGIEAVWKKAKQNAFYRGVPFIWCSNNLTTAFAIQCYWYRRLSSDKQFAELEQANFDWLFGCNPWGTGMVYGLPGNADTPSDPHSAFTKIGNYPIDGGLVDGPVYGSIYSNLIGITLYAPDEYAPFQSDLVVYHDDYGDYSTNEPTMDGTASLIYLLAQKQDEGNDTTRGTMKTTGRENEPFSEREVISANEAKAVTRGDSSQKKIAIVFTGHEFADGGDYIAEVLKMKRVKASFFLTGDFFDKFGTIVRRLKDDGHYLGAHSNKHLLYCSWENRDSLLVTRSQFLNDLSGNYEKMKRYGIGFSDARYFLPPFEWYNDSIVHWSSKAGVKLINYTPGTRSNADYTTPDMKNYRSTDEIYESIINYKTNSANGLKGFILLLHIGTDPARKDKFYKKLGELIDTLKGDGYDLVRINELPGAI